MSLIVYFNSSVRGYCYVPHCVYGPYGFSFFLFSFNFSGAREGASTVRCGADIDMLCASMVVHGADMDICILDCFYVLFIFHLISHDAMYFLSVHQFSYGLVSILGPC